MPGPAASKPASVRTEMLTSGWEFAATAAGSLCDPRQVTDATLQWRKASVPGTVADALRDLGLWSIDNAPRQFDAEDFWYRLRFDNPFQDSGSPIALKLAGLATIADVWLNGEHLLRSDNMFVAHTLPISQLRPTQNELLIRFGALDALLSQKRPRPRWRAPMLAHQQLRYVRTTLLGRTPGWSPPAAAVGPWRGVTLEQHVDARPSNIQFRARSHDGSGTIELHADIDAHNNNQIVSAELVVTGEQERRAACQILNGRLSATMVVPDVRLWWPHTHGEPYLYAAYLNVTTSAGNSFKTQPVQLGFRDVRIDTENDNFSVWINDVRIFCRGACWTPIDVVTLSGTNEQYSEAITQVRACGMNMLRVGGTMTYENDVFYDECDRQGILVWQDFMFANMDYPQDDAAFSASVALELRQQLTRLAARPSIAVFCGNSEVEQQAAMWGAPKTLWNPKLFHTVIAELTKELAPGVPYWPSSAHGGAFPHQPNTGTTSYYGVGAYLRPLDDARRSEVTFATECLAFANIPQDATIEKMPRGLALRVHHPEWKARTPRDLGAGWDFEDVRDHYLNRLYAIDTLRLRYGDHDRYLELSRMITGEVMAATYSEWRTNRSACNGGLIWFLRDFWPGAGWGVVDSDSTPKAPFYYLRRVLQPLLLSITDEGCNGIELHIVNDGIDALQLTLSLTLYRNGELIVGQGAKAVTATARTSVQISATELLEGFSDLSYAFRFGPPSYEVAVATLHSSAGQLLTQACYFPTKNILQQSDLGLTAVATAKDARNYELTLRARRFAHTVTVRADGYECEDQYFHLLPEREHRVILTSLASGGLARPLRGYVHSLNAIAPIKIELR